MTRETFRKAAKEYKGSIFEGSIFPLPKGRKNPPPKGRTGADGETTRATVKADARRKPRGNVGLRVPAWLVGLDVDGTDHGEGSVGPETLAAFEQVHGDLPATLYSSRHGGESETRIRWFSIPQGVILSQARFGGKGVDVIQHHHRFAVVWPSELTDGSRYHWYDEDGDRLRIPAAGHIAPLPASWIEALRADAEDSGLSTARVTADEAEAWMDAEHDAEMSPQVEALIDAIPRDGEGDATLREHLLRVIGAAHRAGRGRRASLEAFESAWFDGHPDPSGNRQKFWTHDVPGVIAKVADEIVVPPPLTPFDDAPRRRKGAKKKPKAKSAKKKPKAKKKHRPAHDEYAPRGTVGHTFPPEQPMLVAHDIIDRKVLPPLIFFRDTWHLYEDAHWQPTSEAAVFNRVAASLRDATFDQRTAKGMKQIEWSPTPGKVAAVVRMLEAAATIAAQPLPLWLGGKGDGMPAHLVPARDGLLDPRTGDTFPRSRHFFSLNHLDADISGASEPVEWLRFLDTLWPGDKKSKRLLQEWFGYVISGDVRRHKGMLLIGPPRSGKGTIMTVAGALVGGEGRGMLPVTMSSFSKDFGLQGLESAALVVLGDLRGSGREAAQAAQSLLEIIGGDAININRKFKDLTAIRPSARVMVGSNEMPRLYDDADAISTRFLMLRMTRSFLGKEDHDLLSRLLPELGGIALWALEGYRRLNARDRFTVPESDAIDRAEFRANSAPLTAFVDDLCIRDPDQPGSTIGEVWDAYIAWCAAGHGTQDDRSAFNRQMSALGFAKHRPAGVDGDDTVRGAFRYRGLVLKTGMTPTQKAKRLWPGMDEIVQPM